MIHITRIRMPYNNVSTTTKKYCMSCSNFCTNCFLTFFFYTLGIFFVLPCIETYQKVDLRTITLDVPPQEVTSNLQSVPIVLINHQLFILATGFSGKKWFFFQEICIILPPLPGLQALGCYWL